MSASHLHIRRSHSAFGKKTSATQAEHESKYYLPVERGRIATGVILSPAKIVAKLFLEFHLGDISDYEIQKKSKINVYKENISPK